MYHYNLSLFGEELRKIRKQFGFTLEDVSELSGVSHDALGRIENGKVIPKYETLEYLSIVYKQDLNALLLKYRIDDYSAFYDIKTRLEAKIDKDEFYTLDVEVRELKKLIEFIYSDFYKIYIEQLILLTEAIILYKKNHKYDEALSKLIKAMKLTNSDFTLDDYSSFIYSSMELRILMNIAFILNRLNNKEEYLEILEFCISAVDSKDEIYPKICHNLAGAYRRIKNYGKALELSHEGINACQRNRNYVGLSLLYYSKGLSEYELNKNEYIQTLRTALMLCEAFGQAELESLILKKCKDILK